MHNETKPARDCKVCYVPHNDDIHDATLRIRRWLRQEVTRKLNEGLDPELNVPGQESLVA